MLIGTYKTSQPHVNLQLIQANLLAAHKHILNFTLEVEEGDKCPLPHIPKQVTDQRLRCSQTFRDGGPSSLFFHSSQWRSPSLRWRISPSATTKQMSACRYRELVYKTKQKGTSATSLPLYDTGSWDYSFPTFPLFQCFSSTLPLCIN